ncbi:MAG TPA: PqqD family protein [Gammaproteobacteria bacterium]
MTIEHPSLAQAVHRLALSESGFVFDPVSGQSFTVNETGLDILRQLQHFADILKTRDYLVEHYDANGQDIERDLDDFLATIGEQLGMQ